MGLSMKDHILVALREQFQRWEELLASLSAEQIAAPRLPSHWTIKDDIAHLKAWQQRSIARLEAARANREPVYPRWLAGADPEAESNTDPVNAWIYEAHREHSWAEVHEDWRAGFLRLLELSEGFSERDLLDESRYPWMDGYSLACILLATYDHHQEHIEELLAWLEEHASS